MDLDIRLPLGLLFTSIGAMLACYGLAFNPLTHHQEHPAVNIDLWWGLAMVIFGAVNLLLAWRARR
jgi:hypothetical protein